MGPSGLILYSGNMGDFFMTKYLLNRLVRGLFSIVIVVAIVMLLIYSCLDRNQIFANDPNFSHLKLNAKEQYKMVQWEKYGYLDYVPYADYLKSLLGEGKITQEKYNEVVAFAKNAQSDSAEVAKFVKQFTDYQKEESRNTYILIGISPITLCTFTAYTVQKQRTKFR